MTATNTNPRQVLTRMIGWSCLVTVVLAAAGWQIASTNGADAGIAAIAGIGLALFGGLIGSYLSATSLILPAIKRPGLLFAALGARFAITMIFALGGRFSGLVTPMPFLIAIVVGHMAFLIVDMMILAQAQRAQSPEEAR